MSDNNVIKFGQPEAFFSDSVTEILRSGARAPLTQAIEAEVADFLAKHAELKLEIEGPRTSPKTGAPNDRQGHQSVTPAADRGHGDPAAWPQDSAPLCPPRQKVCRFSGPVCRQGHRGGCPASNGGFDGKDSAERRRIHPVRIARYSRRTISKSSSAEVAAAWLSKVISPCCISTTRSQISSVCA